MIVEISSWLGYAFVVGAWALVARGNEVAGMACGILGNALYAAWALEQGAPSVLALMATLTTLQLYGIYKRKPCWFRRHKWGISVNLTRLQYEKCERCGKVRDIAL